MKRIEVDVIGRVQGVGFRQFTVERARRHGVTGWVKNERDGSVRVVAEGEENALDAFLDDIRSGPSLARVQNVDVHRGGGTGSFPTFSVQY